MNVAKDKKRRQARILELIASRTVGSQSEIVSLLREKEIVATQASISRDIRELGLIKLDGSYIHANGISQIGAESPATRNESIISITPVGANLIVVNTRPGNANAIAESLDSLRQPDMVGSIAGDNTIFIAVLSRAAQGRIMAILRSPRLR